MILDATTKSIEISADATAATTESPITVEYTDLTTTAFTPGSSDTVTNGATAVTAVAAPAASTQRHVKEISIYNADTVNRTYTVKYNNNGTKRTMAKAALTPGQSLIFNNHIGWAVVIQSGAGQIQGTATNDNAAAGNVGEEINNHLPSASGVSLTTATAKTVTSISLTPGDYEVEGVLGLTGDGTTTVGAVVGSISTVNNTLGTDGRCGIAQFYFNNAAFFASSSLCFSINSIRISVSVTTTVYLVAYVGFAAGACTAYGEIRARRIR